MQFGSLCTSFVFQTNPDMPPGENGERNYGKIIIDGGHFRVQTNLEVPTLQLYGGSISGSHALTITKQMLWAGGTMTSLGESGSQGRTVIGENATLYLIGGSQSLDRNLIIFGKVGWYGTGTAVQATTGQEFANPPYLAGTPITNPDSMPPLSEVRTRDGKGNMHTMAVIVHDVLQGQTVTYQGQIIYTTHLWQHLANIPALERVSLAIAYKKIYGQELDQAINNASGMSTALRQHTLQAYLTGERGPVVNATSPTFIGWLKMAGGVVAGVAAGAWGVFGDNYLSPLATIRNPH